MIHINNLVDKIKFFESKNSKNFIIPLSEAKNLHADITKLLLVLQQLQSSSTNKIPFSTSISGEKW